MNKRPHKSWIRTLPLNSVLNPDLKLTGKGRVRGVGFVLLLLSLLLYFYF